MTSSLRAYRNSATEGATHIDILLACYDAVAEDIRLAGKFAVNGDVVSRCRHSEHALLLIGHLESWVLLLDDPELTGSLTGFYEYLRAEILRLQITNELEKFMALALVVCETRAAWQNRQSVGRSQAGVGTEVSHLTGETDGAASRFLASA
jgi:flagellin-specific chaperone FliS